MDYYPRVQLSAAANMEEFGLPDTPLGRLVAEMPLVWGRVDGEIQPCILHPDVHYPGFMPVTAEEVYDED